MKKLIVVRHGDYGFDNHLNEKGEGQMKRISEKLREHIKGLSVYILSSSADRARESTEALSRELDIGFEFNELLWSDEEHGWSNEALLDLIRTKTRVDVIVLVTHYEYANDFPRYFAMFQLKVEDASPFCKRVEKGEAVVIDCEALTLTKLS